MTKNPNRQFSERGMTIIYSPFVLSIWFLSFLLFIHSSFLFLSFSCIFFCIPFLSFLGSQAPTSSQISASLNPLSSRYINTNSSFISYRTCVNTTSPNPYGIQTAPYLTYNNASVGGFSGSANTHFSQQYYQY